MSTPTPNGPAPPGWYPDQAPNGSPQRERWWDGTAWTAQIRPRGAPRGPLVAGVTGALILIAALVTGGVLLFGVGPAAPRDQDAGTGGGSGGSSGPPSAGPETPANGVQLPVLPGWVREDGGAAVSTGEYPCPGDDGTTCLRGGSTVAAAGTEARTAEAAAKEDITPNSRQVYQSGTYGGITAHKVLASERVTVAGQQGYRVRWRITNRVKPDAYVESLAFPHPDGSGRLLMLRSGFDIHKGAPPLSDMDRIAEGVRRAEP